MTERKYSVAQILSLAPQRAGTKFMYYKLKAEKQPTGYLATVASLGNSVLVCLAASLLLSSTVSEPKPQHVLLKNNLRVQPLTWCPLKWERAEWLILFVEFLSAVNSYWTTVNTNPKKKKKAWAALLSQFICGNKTTPCKKYASITMAQWWKSPAMAMPNSFYK